VVFLRVLHTRFICVPLTLLVLVQRLLEPHSLRLLRHWWFKHLLLVVEEKVVILLVQVVTLQVVAVEVLVPFKQVRKVLARTP
jgi:hypothetical protein